MLTRHGVPAVIVILNNSSWLGNALARSEIQPGIGSWDMTLGLRYAVMQPLGCHVKHVEQPDLALPLNTRWRAARSPSSTSVPTQTAPAFRCHGCVLRSERFISMALAC